VSCRLLTTCGTHPGSLTILASNQEAPIVRILLAEDFASYRSVIASLLTKNPEFRVIGEAYDGLEVVKKAAELGPDLIFMDIGLPKLNGLEAARRVLEFDPSTKIVFLTQESDTDVVRGALSLAASGYLLKREAEAELLTAIAAVLQSKRFVGRGISPDGFGSETGPERAG
jgi:DNA-binding NarL/FixJ family response regulator